MADDSYREIIGRLRTNAPEFLRKHIQLGREEISELIAANLRAAAWFAGALVFVTLLGVAFVVLVVALIALLLPLWAAALVTLLGFVLIAALLAFIGYRSLVLKGPERTIAQVKESAEWLKSRLSKPNENS